MLGGDQDKPKILADNSLEPDWLTAGYKMERREMWWDTNKKARYDRNFCGTLVNIFYFFILITELILSNTKTIFIRVLCNSLLYWIKKINF